MNLYNKDVVGVVQEEFLKLVDWTQHYFSSVFELQCCLKHRLDSVLHWWAPCKEHSHSLHPYRVLPIKSPLGSISLEGRSLVSSHIRSPDFPAEMLQWATPLLHQKGKWIFVRASELESEPAFLPRWCLRNWILKKKKSH